MQRILKPYIRGGGAQAFKNANFQALTQDLLKAPGHLLLLRSSYNTYFYRSLMYMDASNSYVCPIYSVCGSIWIIFINLYYMDDNIHNITYIEICIVQVH